MENTLLALRHYSRTKPIKCQFASGSISNFFTIKAAEPIENKSFSKGDPVTFVYLDDNSATDIIGGSILSMAGNDSIIISPDKPGCGNERRKYERYPLSIFGYVKHGGHKDKVETVCIKDMSYEGIRICTHAELQKQESIELNMCVHNKVLNIEGIVLRKTVSYDRFEYGIMIQFRYKSMIYSTREYLDSLVMYERRLMQNYLTSI